MLVFIDDSGDTGFKFGKGSTRFFVIALVIFDDELEAEKTAVKIKELRRSLKFPDDAEFRFFKSSQSVRLNFLKSIAGSKFRVRCLVIDKTTLRSNELRSNKNSFYSYAIKLVLKHSNDSILNAKVRIDGSGDRDFRRSFISYLRRQLNSREKKILHNCKMVDSKGNVLIQAADMIAGSIKRSWEEFGTKKDARIYKDIIKKKLRMSGYLNNKKQPFRAISDHVPILVVPITPPSGDSSEYRSL